jgi:hypothetical protein
VVFRHAYRVSFAATYAMRPSASLVQVGSADTDATVMESSVGSWFAEEAGTSAPFESAAFSPLQALAATIMDTARLRRSSMILIPFNVRGVIRPAHDVIRDELRTIAARMGPQQSRVGSA